MKCIAIGLLVFVTIRTHTDALFKMTKVECLVVDKNYVNFTECRLKAVRRDVAEFTMRLQLLKTFADCELHVVVLRKYNTYKPFVLDGRFDVCAYLKYRKFGKALDILFNLINDYTNLNKTCPYNGEVIIDRFVPKHSNLQIPLPNGEYLIKTDWYTAQKFALSVNIWFVFKELEAWEKV